MSAVTQTSSEPPPELRSLLRPDLLADAGAVAQLGSELRAGNACIIRDAFREDFAESVFAFLDGYEGWVAHEMYQNAFTCLALHGIPDPAVYSPDLQTCERVLGGEPVRRWISELSGEDCEGRMLFDPRLSLPGDFISPHSDGRHGRTVNFVWLLAKQWRANWGGHFFWCSPPTNIVPTFNTLLLFRAKDNYHAVTPVSPYAATKRLSISGWWAGRDAAPVVRPAPGDWFRGPVRASGSGLFFLG